MGVWQWDPLDFFSFVVVQNTRMFESHHEKDFSNPPPSITTTHMHFNGSSFQDINIVL